MYLCNILCCSTLCEIFKSDMEVDGQISLEHLPDIL